MKFSEFADRVASEAGVTIKTTKLVMRAYAKVLKEILMKGETFTHPSLFTAFTTEVPERAYSDFKGGIEVKGPMIRVHFKPTLGCKYDVRGKTKSK